MASRPMRYGADGSQNPASVGVLSRTRLRMDAGRSETAGFADDAFRGVEEPEWIVPILDNVDLDHAFGDKPLALPQFVWIRGSPMIVPADHARPHALSSLRIDRIGSPLPAQAYLARHEVQEAPP